MVGKGHHVICATFLGFIYFTKKSLGFFCWKMFLFFQTKAVYDCDFLAEHFNSRRFDYA